VLTSAQKHPDTRDRIIETGLRLFSMKGYLGATTREIAKEAGVAEVTLFRHFPAKETLFVAVINTYSFLPELKGLLPNLSSMPYEESLTVIAKRFLDTLTLRKDMIRIMHSEMHRYPEKIHKIYHAFSDELFKTLASYFEHLQKKGVLRPFHTQFGARAFLGMFFSYFNAQEFLMRNKFRPVDSDEVVRTFVSIFVKGTLKEKRG
jgi:AcrR family transcriptional regulator